jgi:SEC-C motif domain protein
MLPTTVCPCGRLDAKRKSLAYGPCCGQWLESDAPAPDAESLMRSRYSAFVLERREYLLLSWHANQRPASLEFDPGVKWLGLEVRSHRVIDASHAEVEFIARQKLVRPQCDCMNAAGLCGRLAVGFMWMVISANRVQLSMLMSAVLAFEAAPNLFGSLGLQACLGNRVLRARGGVPRSGFRVDGVEIPAGIDAE